MLNSEAVQGICRHMNDDHPEMALRIVRALGGHPGAERAETVGVDELGLHFVAHERGSATPVAVPFVRSVAERPQVRSGRDRALSARRCAWQLTALNRLPAAPAYEAGDLVECQFNRSGRDQAAAGKVYCRAVLDAIRWLPT